MKKIALNVPFSKCEHYSCDYVALDALLEFYGYCTPQVLHDQWCFFYRPPSSQPLQVATRMTTLQQNLKRCGIRIIPGKATSLEAAWQHAQSRLQQGHPVAVLTDTWHLEKVYYPGLGHHSGHYVILAGFDEKAETVHLVDASWIVHFRGEMLKSVFRKAWASEIFSGCNWVDMHTSEPGWRLTADQAAQTLRRNADHMRRPSSPSGDVTGLYALQTLGKDISHWKNLPSAQVQHHLQHLYNQLKFVVIERDGYGRYLQHAAGILKMSVLKQATQHFHTLTQKWLVFRNLCFKAQKKDSVQILEKLHSRILEITTLEADALASFS
ncbi:MAG: BtrH N-terminal domain-containing protein [bacterium]|nr:BtrH N-terminal domain-containing protein [bacterium]